MGHNIFTKGTATIVVVCDKMDTAQYKYQQHVQYFENGSVRYLRHRLFIQFELYKTILDVS